MNRALPILLPLLASCAAAPAAFTNMPETRITWPLTESPPRLSVLFIYRGVMDARQERGFWGGLGDALFGREQTRLVAPYGLALQRLGEEEWLLVADPALSAIHRISLRTAEHQLILAGAAGPLVSPIGLAVLPDGRFFATDSAACMVHAFDAGGEPAGSFGSAASLGRPTGLVWDEARRRLLLLDTTGGRLLALDQQGVQLAVVGGPGAAPGRFNRPTNLALAADGRVFVVDSMNFRVQVLGPELELRSAFGIAGDGPGAFSKPKGIALDSDGNIYVVDAMFDNVQVFDQDGVLLLAFGQPGTGFGCFTLPSGILIDHRDRVFVSDVGNSRVQVFQYHGESS